MVVASKDRQSDQAKPPESSLLEQKFMKLGLCIDEDFVMHLPMRYEDETRLVQIAELRPGMTAQVEGEIVRSDISFKPRRQLTATLSDNTGSIALRWMTFYPSQQQQMKKGRRWRVRGEVRAGYHGLEIIHPKVTACASPLSSVLTPVYGSTEGLSQVSLRKAILKALSRVALQDTLPENFIKKLGLISFEQAIRTLHAPAPDMDLVALLEHTHPAWRRVKFDELLAQQLSLAAARDARRLQRAIPLPANKNRQDSLPARLLKNLVFTLTSSQQSVIQEIADDLAKPYPMYRLLQGDVGSGKTIVAAFAALQAIDNGVQVAIMAPTEILAEQHYRKLSIWCEPLGIDIAWLTGSLTVKAKKDAAARIASGFSRLVIGTQALIQESVHFNKLGLVIVDEQHRFGVNQRLSLSRKGENIQDGLFIPHQLAMSATPIPRTLAMTFYADLEVSSIVGLPPGRSPVTTKLFASSRRNEVIEHIAHAVKTGQQIYWVCPLIEESETLELQTAVDTYAALTESLHGVSIGLIHGRLSTVDKTKVMRDFRDGSIQVLVATTVIEVGVDVPTASLMIIEHAERFGLAQLHQLRGRVGRGHAKSVCVLLYDTPLSDIARQRLRAMFETQDGFEIAQRDLDLRGPGELLGSRQSGVTLLRFADLSGDGDLVNDARETATELRASDLPTVDKHLNRWMRGKQVFLRS